MHFSNEHLLIMLQLYHTLFVNISRLILHLRWTWINAFNTQSIV